MGWVQEITELFAKLRFFEIVYEYEQGLYFRNGIAQERRVKRLKQMKPKELEEIITGEKEAILLAGGTKAFLPFRKPTLPVGYRRSLLTGFPIHPKRFSKVLKPGLYLHFPIIDDIVKDYIQEVVANCPFIVVHTADEENISIATSCNIRYQVTNFYLAYTAVHDYKVSLRDHALSILAQKSMGKHITEWKNAEEIKKLGHDVEQELRKIVTEKWGIKINQVYITDVVPCTAYKLLDETQRESQRTPVIMPAE